MHKTYAAWLCFSLVVIFLLSGCSSKIPAADEGGSLAEESRESFGTIATGSTGAGDVLVELTPRGLTDGRLLVDVAVNTHSVSLEQFDLKKMATLEFNGRTLKPLSAPKLTGHHSSGALIFEVGEGIGSYTITIEGMPAVQTRRFRWE